MRKHHLTVKPDRAKYCFGDDRSTAWAFMRAMDERGNKAGFPTLRAPYCVTVLIPSWKVRDVADKLAGVPPIEYEFGKKSLALRKIVRKLGRR